MVDKLFKLKIDPISVMSLLLQVSMAAILMIIGKILFLLKIPKIVVSQ